MRACAVRPVQRLIWERFCAAAQDQVSKDGFVISLKPQASGRAVRLFVGGFTPASCSVPLTCSTVWHWAQYNRAHFARSGAELLHGYSNA